MRGFCCVNEVTEHGVCVSAVSVVFGATANPGAKGMYDPDNQDRTVYV